jgi:sugar phosphate isomerase/epimerase
MTKEYPAESWEQVLDGIAAQGMRTLHLNPASARLNPDGAPLLPQTTRTIAAAATARGLDIAAISGTYNMIHPDPNVRAAGYARLGWLIRHAGALGAPYVTLCTGTLDPHNMWRTHPGNDDPACFRLLEHELEPALTLCSETGVSLLIEPETSNVVNTPEKAAQLLRDIASPNLGVIMDAANLFPSEKVERMQETLVRAFDLLGAHIRIAHAKDIAKDATGFTRPGLGVVDFPFYLSLLRRAEFDGALILHGFSASAVPDAANYITSIWEG